jgi:ABC-2 type transport system ATP-binding protein
MIHIRDLHKDVRIYRHHRGGLGALRNLATREYQVVRAVDGVSFDIARGELVGYLGPNRAGKSTTIKILTGILLPTGGEVRVDGRVDVSAASRVSRAQCVGRGARNRGRGARDL